MVRTSIVAAAAFLGFGLVAEAFVAPAGRAIRMTEAPTSQTTPASSSGSESGSESGSGSRRAHVDGLGSRREALLGGMALSSAVLLGTQLQPALAAGGPAVSSYYTQVRGDSVGGCVYGPCVRIRCMGPIDPIPLIQLISRSRGFSTRS